MSEITSALARNATMVLRRRWPGAEITSTAAGRGRVSVAMPLVVARALRLAGPGADTAAAGAELAELFGWPVSVMAVRHLSRGHGGHRYAVLIDLTPPEGR
jgi:hypothetical protein